MAKVSVQDILDTLKEMSILEVNELVKAVEAEFGVSAAAVAAPAAAPAEEAHEEGPKEVTVFLKSVGASKIPVIKAVQAITGLGLLDAKKLCDALPAAVKENISPAAAEDIKKQLTEAGAEVEVK